jgi:hypothetical protein
MHLLTLNAAGKQLAPPQTLAPSRRRLSQVIGRHVDRSRPHMIAVQRARDPLQPIEEAWVTRGRDKAGNVRPWPRLYLPADAIVVIVYLPRGGGGGASGGSKKSPLSIALGIASVALIAFAGPLGVAAAGALGLGTTAGTIITAGLVLGGTALLGLASRAKANKTPTDTTQVYGVSGGGNAPRPGDRIPKLYGRVWVKPDLSQPDFSQYDGDDQILFKRQTITLGRCRIYQARVGKQVVWQEGAGFLAPFNDARNAIEFIYGTASTLVPNSNISATGVGGQLPRLEDIPNRAGPFLINQRGALINRLQFDFQFPQGIARTDFLKSGSVRSNQPGEWGVLFRYAPIDESGAIIGPWQVGYSGNSGNEGARFATHPLRYTKFVDVPPGRYAVDGVNVAPDTSNNTTGNAHQNTAQWDAASGWVADAAIRPGVSEVCMRIYATKGTQAAAFGELELDAAAIVPVWTGNGWVDVETSKAVWAFVDIMRNGDYGGALPDSQIDLGTALGYANLLTQFDTFDGLIRGPVSVYEAAATALLPMRAEPVHLGRYWSLVRDEPKAVRRHVITPRQMTKGSTQLVFDLDTAAGAGHVIGEFDQDGDYRNPNQTTAIYGEASLTPTRQRWTGVRTFEHAQHLTRWRAAAGAFRRQTAPFGVEMEGRIYKRGDSILVDPWFIDARRRAGVTDNRGDTLHLDANIELQPGDAVIFRDRTGRAWGPVSLAGQSGPRELRLDSASRVQVEQATGKTLGSVLSDGRGDMTTILVGPVSSLAENYLIQSVKPSGPDKAQVEALIDDPRVWAAIGAAIVIPPEGAAGLTDPESPRIVALTANATPVAAGFRCDYTILPGRGAVRFEVGLSYDNGNHFDTRPEAPVSGSLDLNPVDPTNIVLRARAFGLTGLPGPYFLTELALPRAALNADLPPIDYEAFTQEVKDRFTHIQEVEEYAQGVAQQAKDDFDAAKGRADDAFDKAIEALGIGSDNAALIYNETQSRLSADEAFVSQTNILIAQMNTDRAYVLSEQQVRIDNDASTASDLFSLSTQIGTNAADIVSERTSRTDADTAMAQTINGLSARVGPAEASIIDLYNVTAARDEANAQYILSIESTVNANEALFLAEVQTRADADTALVGYIQLLQSAVGDNYGTLTTEMQTRADADSALGSRIDSTLAIVGTNYGLVVDESTARANADSALAQSITDVQAYSAGGTASGRFSLVAASAPSGVTVRLQALLASQFGGQTYGAGYYLDLLSDGSSRFVIDANAFYITNNGSSVPLLSFDGFTLRVPNLVLTAPNVPQGVASVPARFDASNYTLIAGQGAVNNVFDPNMITNIYVDNGNYPTIVSLYGSISMGPGTSVGPLDLVIDGNQVAPVLFGGVGVQATTINNPGNTAKFYGFAVVYLGAGNHQARFRYTYSGNQSGSQVVISDIHLAAVTPRA